MTTKIPEIYQSRKTKEYLLIASVVLLAITSFGLGRISHNTCNTPIIACSQTPGILTQSPKQEATVIEAVTEHYNEQQSTYIGSKNGTVYHLPWCSGAQRISEENKIWFTSKEDAEDHGYRPAANCKGI